MSPTITPDEPYGFLVDKVQFEFDTEMVEILLETNFFRFKMSTYLELLFRIFARVPNYLDTINKLERKSTLRYNGIISQIKSINHVTSLAFGECVTNIMVRYLIEET